MITVGRKVICTYSGMSRAGSPDSADISKVALVTSERCLGPLTDAVVLRRRSLGSVDRALRVRPSHVHVLWQLQHKINSLTLTIANNLYHWLPLNTSLIQLPHDDTAQCSLERFVLGSLLFLYYLKGLTGVMSIGITIYLFADNSNITISGNSWEDIEVSSLISLPYQLLKNS